MSEQKQSNLFQTSYFAEFVNSNIVVDRVERIEVDRFVTILGCRMDLQDLYETLYNVIEGDVCLVDNEMTRTLKKMGVIDSFGSRRSGIPAYAGPNMEQFFKKIKELYYSEPNEPKADQAEQPILGKI